MEQYLNKHIYFNDNFGDKKAGHVLKVENEFLIVHSFYTNSRGVSKTFTYSVNKTDIIKIISKDEAIKYAHSPMN